MGIKEESVERERRALRYSMVIAAALAVMAAVWGWISQSQVILLDGVYALIGMILTWLSLRVSRIAESGPTARFPFGKQALTPVVIAVQGMALLATLVYAAAEAIRVILAGGADVAAGSIAAYGAISAVISVIIWQYIGKLDRTSDLLVAEAKQWGASAAFERTGRRRSWRHNDPGPNQLLGRGSVCRLGIGPCRLRDAGPAGRGSTPNCNGGTSRRRTQRTSPSTCPRRDNGSS